MAKDSVCAQDINRFHIAESKKFYWSSKSSEHCLVKVQVTQLMVRWTSLATYNSMLDRFFNPHVRWKSDSANYRNTKQYSSIILPPPKKVSLLLGTWEHGSASRNFRFSLLTQLLKKINKVIFVSAKRIRK